MIQLINKYLFFMLPKFEMYIYDIRDKHIETSALLQKKGG